MRIREVRIRRYRSVVDLKFSVDDYTALIGANGAGKSSILYALDWFFNSGTLSREDVHTTRARPYDPEESDIDVEVVFDELTEQDRQVLGRYGRGPACRLRRTWNAETAAEKMFGNSMGGPGFRAVESATPVTTMRTAYKQAREQFPELPDVLPKAEIIAALAAWESDPVNKDKLVEVAADDASHMFGVVGQSTLSRCVRYVLVPASTEIAASVGQAVRGSVLQQLLGSVMTEVAAAEVQDWVRENSEAVASLGKRVEAKVDSATAAHAARVNGLLGDLVPNAELRLVPAYPDWLPRADVTVRSQISVDGQQTDVGRQGHGTQRALLLAILQSLVPIASTTDGIGAGSARSPALVVSIEEPEIFQHPVRARHFARVLTELSTTEGTQVLIATHSPYFVLPEQVGALRRCRSGTDGTVMHSTSVSKIAALTERGEQQVSKNLEREIPTTFSEAFFAESVLLVEGDTDRVVVETLARQLGLDLEANGTAVVSVFGKENLRPAFAVLQTLGIDVYVLVDGDYGVAARKHPDPGPGQDNVRQSNKKATDEVLGWLLPAGDVSCVFGGPTEVSEHWTVLHDDLEAELECWPDFVAELASAGKGLRSKDTSRYRAAALAASVASLPPNLCQLMNALKSFSQAARLGHVANAAPSTAAGT